MSRLATMLATSGGAGYAPIAPGTAGSAVGVLVFALIAPQGTAVVALATVAIAVAGIWAAERAMAVFNSKDPGPVVIDEVAGQLVTLCGHGGDWVTLVAGFLVFRLFDIVKPWPVGALEALPGGVGIMADDLMAGVYASLTLYLCFSVLPGMF